jgi:hypothetical protein
MHFSIYFKRLFWIIPITIYVVTVVILNSLDSGTYKFDEISTRYNESVTDKNATSVYIQLKEYDSTSQNLKARLWIYPPEEYAVKFGSSVQVKKDTRIQIDAARVETSRPESTFWYEYEFIRAFDIELDATNELVESRYSDKWFPFDKYSVPITGTVDYRTSGSDTEKFEDDTWVSTPIEVVTYTSNLPGWSAEFSYYNPQNTKVISQEDGQWDINLVLERTNLNRAILILLALIFIGGGTSMLMLLRSIMISHRPPTLSGLVWSASTAFTMIQTRTVIPGTPRVGVMFDLFIFYPALAMTFISGGFMFFYWLTKESLSREM